MRGKQSLGGRKLCWCDDVGITNSFLMQCLFCNNATLERFFREDKVNGCLRTLLACFLLVCICGGNVQ